MKIGENQVFLVEAEGFKYDAGLLFGNLPYSKYKDDYKPDKNNMIKMVSRLMLIQSKVGQILVDTGPGEKLTNDLRSSLDMKGPANTLQESLQTLGTDPSEITHIIVSHLHYLVAGGLTRYVGSKCVPAFENAVCYIQQEQWEWANIPSLRDKTLFNKEDFLPLAQFEKLKLFNDDYALSLDVEVQALQGHTPGYQVVKISSDGKTIIYPGQLIPTVAHLSDEVNVSSDLYPLFSLEEKYHFLTQAAEQGWIIVLANDPNHKAITVELTEHGFVMKENMDALFA